MCELESCLCNEGISDVQFTSKDCGWDMVDFGRVDRRGWPYGMCWRWCKCCSRLESDGFSPETLFLEWERGRLTGVTVSPRLAPRATASSEVKERRGFDLKLVRDGRLELGRSRASVALKGDRFEAGCRSLVFGLRSSAIEAELALGAVVSAGIVDGGLGWVGVGHEGSSGFGGNGGGSVIGRNDAALSFLDIVGGVSGSRGGVCGFEPGFGVMSGGGGARSIGPGNLEVFAEFFGGLEFHELP